MLETSTTISEEVTIKIFRFFLFCEDFLLIILKITKMYLSYFVSPFNWVGKELALSQMEQNLRDN